MSSLKSYKFRLYPTRTQTEKLEWTLARCCELYNAALQERREMYTYTGKGTTYNAQAMQLPEIKEIREEYKQIHSQVLQDVLRRVDKAFKAFFKRVKVGKRGFPRFQGRNHYESFCYPQAGFSLENGRLELSKIGHVKIKLHRKVHGTIKTCTLKREGACWYVCFSCEVESVPRTPYTDEAVGIDLGISKLATLSTGDVIENPKHYRQAEKRLAKAQQALSRKKRGSKRRKKAVQRVARLHRKVRNQRNDYLHQWSRRLVDTYETIVFEDIAPTNLSRRARPRQDEETGKYLPNGASAKSGLNKSILDAGWSQFIAFCEYKAENAGTVQVAKVDPRMTSQVCSGCGSVVKKELSERWHSCECGTELDRDHNASINIKHRWLGRSLQETQAS
ncbi:transposase [Ktedonobacter sp. SOSP1-85]|uniref:RNA-guided endonuclease InsQ/TnpB family protein n=1 Tax=Ktedonobacter sp. SOSP1-85 TaxID=2778367 RepID=UPI0019150E78|nr:RNA-guided endonuclease TnpB family protein [Ktedonobacter sp. SOSP1-85]GHO79200.1 transposase [Ktedonobacter sp. SOSP1-85]